MKISYIVTSTGLIPADNLEAEKHGKYQCGAKVTLQMPSKQRSLTQNKALHKYFELLAEELNEHGFDMMAVLRHDVEIPWDKDLVKYNMWRPLQKKKLGFPETSKLNREQVSSLYDILSRHIAKVTGVSTAFPSKDLI